MANITKKNTLTIKGRPTLNEENKIQVEVDGLATPILLSDYIEEFLECDCSINFSLTNNEA